MRVRAIMPCSVACVIAGAAAINAASSVSGPVTAVVFDARAKALRPINGIPGASSFGQPISLPTLIRRAALSPNGQTALGVSDEEGGRVLCARKLMNATAEAIPVEGAIPDPDLISWAPNNASAVVYSGKTAQFQVITGLEETPMAQAPIALPDPGDPVVAAALSSDNSFVIFATFDGNGGAVSMLDLNRPQNAVPMLKLSGKSVVAFANEERDLIIADVATGDIWYVEDLREARNAFIVAGAKNGIFQPGCLQSLDHRRVVVGDSSANALYFVDSATSAVTKSIPLTASPTRCGLSTDGSAIVISDDRSGQVLLLDTSQDLVYFVPMSQ